MFVPNFETFKVLSLRANLIPVYKELLADIETPVTAYLKLKGGPFSFLLESAEGGEKWGRYSFIGLNPLITVTYQFSQMVIKREKKNYSYSEVDDPVPLLRKIIKKFHLAEVEGLPRFQGGLVGYFAYDVIRCWENLPGTIPKDTSTPEAMFILPQELIIFDHVSHTMKIVTFVHIEGDDNLEGLYKKAKKRIDYCLKKLSPSFNYKTLPLCIGSLRSNFTKEQFMEAVKRIKDYILNGDVIQVVLSQRLESEFSGDAFSIYRALRSLNPSPYMFYLDFGYLKLVGTSPEVLVRLENNLITLRPIAGTRPRGHTQSEDRALEQELLADPKEQAEHIMLVDLGRNDVGKVASPGSVKATELMSIEHYSHVMHIVSNIIGKLKEGEDSFSVLKASFPAGTVTGAPKVRAMQIIDELEPIQRGPYAGAVGYFSFSENMDFCITIRTVIVCNNKLFLQVGAGIVADSIPEREYEETVNKAKAMVRALDWAKNGL
jgi:anthranilate synthase component 1